MEKLTKGKRRPGARRGGVCAAARERYRVTAFEGHKPTKLRQSCATPLALRRTIRDADFPMPLVNHPAAASYAAGAPRKSKSAEPAVKLLVTSTCPLI
jgi:hypothetical protein